MSDKNPESRMREKALALAQEAHCRYCDRWQLGHHPAERCPGDIEATVKEITQALLSVARESEQRIANLELDIRDGIQSVESWIEIAKQREAELAQARADLERAQGRVAELEGAILDALRQVRDYPGLREYVGSEIMGRIDKALAKKE